MSQTNQSIVALESNFTQTQFVVKELKDYVDHFGDNLVLPASNITVEPATGFASKPMNLAAILKICKEEFLEVEVKTDGHRSDIKNIREELMTKAPESILFNIATAERKIAAIELHLQKEEEHGISVSFFFIYKLLNSDYFVYFLKLTYKFITH
jgi:hypothetical protein